MQEYFSVAKETESEIIIQKSRFITKVVPVNNEEQARSELEKIRQLHWEANHNVYAYRLGQVERFSDDGEPSGTAGRPVLEVLRKEDVDNVLVVVTRYFGGTLLGAGGLVRAYTQSAKVGLEQAGRVKQVLYRQLTVVMDYNWVDRVQYEAEIRGYLKEKVEYSQQVTSTYVIPESEIGKFREYLLDISAGRLSLEPGALVYRAESY